MKCTPPPASRLAKYGMTTDDWWRLFNAQEGKCLLCHRKFTSKRRPNIDHDHTTGEVRGLLDTYCNVTLGAMHEAAAWFYEAWQYLTEPFARRVFNTPRRHVDAAPPEEPQG